MTSQQSQAATEAWQGYPESAENLTTCWVITGSFSASTYPACMTTLGYPVSKPLLAGLKGELYGPSPSGLLNVRAAASPAP